MNLKFSVFLFALLNSFIISSQKKYINSSVTNQWGDKIDYVKELVSSSSFNKNFNRYDKNGDIESSGSITVIQNIPVFGSRTAYNLMYTKEEFIYVDYKFINDKLNGLHYVGSFDFNTKKIDYKANYVAVIDNNIVGSSYTNSSLRPGRKSNSEAGFSVEYKIWRSIILETPNYTFSGLETYDEEELYYDLEMMVNIFLEDFGSYLEKFSNTLKNDSFGKNNRLNEYLDLLKSLKKLTKSNKVYSVFEELEGSTIGKSFGIDDNENIIIKVDPSKWLESSHQNKWYILYHELGHDVLNLRHGQGGRMMFNYPTKNYSWEDFFKDRQNMFIYFIKKVYPDYDNLFILEEF
jgi:hypothetical protein